MTGVPTGILDTKPKVSDPGAGGVEQAGGQQQESQSSWYLATQNGSGWKRAEVCILDTTLGGEMDVVCVQEHSLRLISSRPEAT